MAAKRIIIVHQWMAGADGDWRPWLKAELEKRGHQVSLPEMPDIDVPVIEKWVGKLAEVVSTPDPDTYFVGHSIGCQAILRYLQTIRTPVGGAVFVAGWFDLKNLESAEVAEIAAPWIHTPINADAVRAVLSRSTLIISDNDPYDCLVYNSQEFGALGSKIIVIPKGGHLSAQDGYTQCQPVLDEVIKILA